MIKLLKNVLKTVFPVLWLKKVFLIYNLIRINTIDKLLFPEYILGSSEFLIKKDIPVYDQLQIDETKFSSEIQIRLKLWHNWTQDEYLLAFDHPCIIEPKQGWALSEGKIIYPSLGFGRTSYIPKPDFIKLHLLKKKQIHFNQIISLRDTGEENYFHFYNDVLAKLTFLDEHITLSHNIPVLISDKLYQKPYFQFYLKNSSLLQNRHWIVQEGNYIMADKTYFCKPLTHTKKYLDMIVNSLSLENHYPQYPYKIFLSRNPRRLRYITNLEEVTKVCKKHGFNVIDTDNLSLEEQISLFSSASHVIGIHGAGLINMIYGRKNIKKIIEVFPPWNYAPFHYIMLAKMYGFEYDAILGKENKDKSRGGFTVCVDELEQKISMLESTLI